MGKHTDRTMNKTNNKYSDEPDDDYSLDDEEYEDSDFDDDDIPDGYHRNENLGENVNEKPTIDNFFNTEQLLQEVEKTMKGFQKKNGQWVYVTLPKARDNFINTMMNDLRSVINQQNMISKMDKDDIKFLLLEKNKEFIYLIYEEPSIEDEDVESVINIFDHALQLFMGQVQDGHGARTLKQVSASVAYEVETKSRDDSLLSLGWGNQNILKIGGSNEKR